MDLDGPGSLTPHSLPHAHALTHSGNGRIFLNTSVSSCLFTSLLYFQVKLTIQKLAVQAIPRPTLVKKNNGVNEELIRLISGDRLSLERPSLDGIPHVALYLTLDSGEGEHDKVGHFVLLLWWFKPLVLKGDPQILNSHNLSAYLSSWKTAFF